MVEVKVKFFGEPYELNQGRGDWIDLQARESRSYYKGEIVYIPLGVAMQLPEGYEAHILPRSSTVIKFGLIHVASGIIDNGYCGNGDEWHFVGYSIKDENVFVGDRVCQFRLVRNMQTVEFTTVPELNNSDRGGFGSTGK